MGVLPPKWMVYFMENPMNKWMIWGVNTIFLVQHPYTLKVLPLVQPSGWSFGSMEPGGSSQDGRKWLGWAPHLEAIKFGQLEGVPQPDP